MKIVLLSFLLILTGAVEWVTNFDIAKDQATRDNKLILLNFSGSDWCAPCIKMKKEVFENEAFLSIAAERLVLVRADFPRTKKNQLPKEQLKHNEALAEKYNPSGKFPYTILLDAKGKVIKEWDGYAFATQEKFISQLKDQLSLND
jgi:thioredoxin-related protein